MSDTQPQTIPGAPPGGFLCAACGARLEGDQFERIDRAISRGNPYPDPLLVCNKPECIAKGDEIAQEEARYIRSEEAEDEEDLY